VAETGWEGRVGVAGAARRVGWRGQVGWRGRVGVAGAARRVGVAGAARVRVAWDAPVVIK
jgi:hypothetical protein